MTILSLRILSTKHADCMYQFCLFLIIPLYYPAMQHIAWSQVATHKIIHTHTCTDAHMHSHTRTHPRTHPRTHAHTHTSTSTCIYHSQNRLCGLHSGAEPGGGNKTGGPVGSGDTSIISTHQLGNTHTHTSTCTHARHTDTFSHTLYDYKQI